MLSSIISPAVPQYTAACTTPHALETGQAHADEEEGDEAMLQRVALQGVRQSVLPGARLFGLGALPTWSEIAPPPTHAMPAADTPALDEEAACAGVGAAEVCPAPVVVHPEPAVADAGVQVQLDLVA